MKMTVKQRRELVEHACQLKAELDAVTGALMPVIDQGEAVVTSFGTITKSHPYVGIRVKKSGKREYDALRQKLLEQGKATKYSAGPQMLISPSIEASKELYEWEARVKVRAKAPVR